jgi:hypothetical protein
VWLTLAFQVARHVVLRADEQALVLPQEMLAQGAITQTDIAAWPLFDRLRTQRRI